MQKLALFLVSCMLAGTVHAVDLTKAEAATQIKSLPATISTPGNYYLAPNIKQLFPAATVPAITITASNVVLDLYGTNIVAFNGILIGVNDAYTNFVVIQNGSITPPSIALGSGPFTAIQLNHAQGCTIDAVNILPGIGSPAGGITDNDGQGNVIKKCFLYALGRPLILADSYDTIVDNVIELYGVSGITSTVRNVFRNNTFNGNGVAVIAFAANDQYIGNAFGENTHTGGRDIAGQ